MWAYFRLGLDGSLDVPHDLRYNVFQTLLSGRNGKSNHSLVGQADDNAYGSYASSVFRTSYEGVFLTIHSALLWRMRLMMVQIAMALRYDYSTSLQLFDRPQSETGERLEQPARTPTFKKPTYTAAMLGLITSLVTLYSGKYYFPKILEGGDAGDVCWMFVTIPLVSLCTMYPHWRNGTVGGWWRYEERW